MAIMTITDAPVHRWTVEDAERLVDAGVLPENGYELIDGVIIDVVPEGWDHHEIGWSLALALRAVFSWDARTTPPIIFGDGTLVFPDVAVLGDSPRFSRPETQNIVLLVEVAKSTPRYDLGDKAALYAREGIVRYAVLDVRRRLFVIHSQPENGVYRTIVESPELDGLPAERFLPRP